MTGSNKTSHTGEIPEKLRGEGMRHMRQNDK